MLAFFDETWQPWRPGSKLPSGLQPPPNAEALMSPEELEAIGLRKVTSFVVPDGMTRTGAPAFSEADGEIIETYEVEPLQEPPPVPLSLEQIACARLSIEEWEVLGVERSQGFAGAFMADTDTIWAFFNEPMPDADYIVLPAEGVTKHPDFVEVNRPGLTEVSFIVQRVQ